MKSEYLARDISQALKSVLVLAATLLAAASAIAQPATGTRPVGKSQPTVVITVTRVDAKDESVRPLPVLVSFANLGEHPLYVAAIEGLSLQLVEEGGNPVGGKAVQDPGPAPKEWYMMKDGHSVLMQPVWRLDPKSGVVCVISDALVGYPAQLPPGQYQLLVPMAGMKVFNQKDVVHRKDAKYELWVEAGANTTAIETVQNSLSFKIAGNAKNP